jgi:carbonic anhydrase
MALTCKALIIHCSDFRFGKAVGTYLEDTHLVNDCDIIAVDSAAKNIASPTNEGDREFVMNQIGLAKSLHEIKQVVVMNHTDCSGYGGRSAFPTRADEEKRHFDDIRKAVEVIASKYSDLAFITVLANIEDDGSIHFDTPPQA